MSAWQSEERLCGVVLREVFPWLEARTLARAGQACRAWSRAAAEPALWRRLLQRRARLRLPLPGLGDAAAWRQEYVAACAGWRLAARHRACAALLHASLAPGGERLALAAADASVCVWQAGPARAQWRELARCELRRRGWSAVARVCWPPAAATRLLIAGPLALSDDWELVVLHVTEDGQFGTITSRVRCSAGAAGCWADAVGDSFLSLELRRLGPGLFCTTVWLNAATQETQSEYTGVRAPLLRIYNEDGAHITHAIVASAPVGDEEPAGDDEEPGPAYWRAVRPGRDGPAGPRVLLAGGGRTLRSWPVLAPRPPPLQARAAGGLAERVRLLRQRRARPPEPAAEPDAASVRAACTPHAHSCRLSSPLVGLVLHERERCFWVVCSDGSATCLSVPTLHVLWRMCELGTNADAGAHYLQPAVSDAYLASPAGEYSPRVWWRSTRSGAGCEGGAAGAGGAGGAAGAGGAGGAALAHGAPAVCCLLPASRPRFLLVLAGDELYVWRSRATLQSGPFDIL